jgi:phosphoglycerate dehydrogenase-like enzyme
MQVLMLERSFARIGRALSERLPAIEPLLMHDDGTLSLHGQPRDPSTAAPLVAWANSDLYDGGPVRDFMVLCLKSRSLRFVQSSAAGFDHPVFGMLVDNGVLLSNSAASAIAIAEFVLASVLDVCHDFASRRRAQAERRWQRQRFRELHGMRWLIVGLGNIGSEVALRARAFGAHVTGVRRTPQGNEPVDRMLPRSELLAALPESDVVVLCAPANRDSVRMVDAEFLAALRRDAILVNVARGALLDEAALLASLERGLPGCAVLDVFETEPLAPESLLWSHPRVRVSAHDSAHGSGFVSRNDALFLDNLERFARGAAPLQLVAPEIVKQAR